MAISTDRLAIHGGDPAVGRELDHYKGAAYIGEEEKRAVMEVLEARSLFRYYGPDLRYKAAGFEEAFAEYLSAPFVAGCSSGTAALRLALIGVGVGAGDEVILPAVTFIASVGAVVAQGAVPVFAEVDSHLTLDPASVEALRTDRTRAIMPVHLTGVAADMDPLLEVAARHGVAVVEDAAQACGSEYRGRKVGAIGDAGAFSFQLEKNITSGEGGALATRDEETYRRAVRYADQGGQFPIQSGGVRDTVGGDPVMGENLRMSEIVGAILGCQLARLDGMLTRVVEMRRAVEEGLSGLPIELPTPAPERDLHALGVLFYLPTAETADRVAEALQAEGVPAGKVYGGAPVYASRQILERRTLTRGCPFSCTCTDHRKPEYWMGMCPRSEDLLARGVGIAVGPRYSDEDVADVVHGLRKVLEQLM